LSNNYPSDMESPANLELWDLVEHVDPKWCKQINLGRRSFTTIDAYYQLRQATSLWGPYGGKWGLNCIELSNFKITETHRDGPVEVTKIVMTAVFFYPDGKFEVCNDMTWKGDDTLKKLTTNTRSKALSFLGFGASIYMGKHEDAQYRKDNEMRFGEQASLVEGIKEKINRSTTTTQLGKAYVRLDQMMYDKILTADSYAELTEAIDHKRKEIAV